MWVYLGAAPLVTEPNPYRAVQRMFPVPSGSVVAALLVDGAVADVVVVVLIIIFWEGCPAFQRAIEVEAGDVIPCGAV